MRVSHDLYRVIGLLAGTSVTLHNVVKAECGMGIKQMLSEVRG